MYIANEKGNYIMPNICSYEMKVIGIKENLDKFVEVLQNDYHIGDKDNKLHMYRVFEAEMFDEEQLSNDKYEYSIYGTCAWSVASCMTDSAASYYADYHKKDVNATCLRHLSDDLNLMIEVYSTEEGMGFQEHFFFDKGNVTINECYSVYAENFDELEMSKGNYKEKILEYLSENHDITDLTKEIVNNIDYGDAISGKWYYFDGISDENCEYPWTI